MSTPSESTFKSKTRIRRSHPTPEDVGFLAHCRKGISQHHDSVSEAREREDFRIQRERLKEDRADDAFVDAFRKTREHHVDISTQEGAQEALSRIDDSRKALSKLTGEVNSRLSLVDQLQE